MMTLIIARNNDETNDEGDDDRWRRHVADVIAVHRCYSPYRKSKIKIAIPKSMRHKINLWMNAAASYL
jgi:hypothetical protein